MENKLEYHGIGRMDCHATEPRIINEAAVGRSRANNKLVGHRHHSSIAGDLHYSGGESRVLIVIGVE